MSAIHELLDQLRAVLSTTDQSDTPHLRKIFSTYCDVCRDLNRQLSECRQLIDRGLLLDAKKLNVEIQPALTERIRVLTLTAEQKSKVEELCRLYDYPIPPELDSVTGELLTRETPAEMQTLSRLILQWRKIAREGKTADKIALLRQIRKLVPQQDTIWRDNLRNAEQSRISELMSEAEEALKQNDGAALNRCYAEMTSPELLEPAAEEKVKKFLPLVQEYQKQELQKQVEEILQKLNTAYSNQNIPGIRNVLQEYDAVASHPLFAAPDYMKQQADDARNYLERYEERQEREHALEQKSAALLKALDNHADFAEIDNLYAAMQQLELPINRSLANRVETRREEQRIQSTHHHHLLCLYGILAAILLLAVGASAIIAIQTSGTIRNTSKAWQKEIDAGNYQAVLDQHQKMQDKNSLALKFGSLNAIKLEAERKLEEHQEQISHFQSVVETLETMLKKPDADLEELLRQNEELKQMEPEQQGEALAARWRKIDTEIRQRERDNQKKQNADWEAMWDPLQAKIEAMEQAMQQGQALPDQLKRDMTMLQEKADLLPQNGQAAPELIKAKQDNFKIRMTQLANRIAEYQKKYQFRKQLLAPDNFAEYEKTLAKLPETDPAALGQWKQAREQMNQCKALIFSAAWGASLKDRQELDKKLPEIRAFVRTTPFVDDLEKLYPETFADRKKLLCANLGNSMLPAFDYYELIFEDDQHRRFCFYGKEVPQREMKRMSPLPKALAMKILTAPQASAQMLLLRVRSGSQGNICFLPEKLDDLPLPEVFSDLLNMEPSSPAFPKAKHEEFLQKYLPEYVDSVTPEDLEKQIFLGLQELKSADVMNIYARALLTKTLLEILPSTSAFYGKLIDEPISVMDLLALEHYNHWMNPLEALRNPRSAEGLNEFFSNVVWDNLQKACLWEKKIHQAAVRRDVIPVGLLLEEHDHTMKLHYFRDMENVKEFWVFLPGSDQQKAGGFYMIRRDQLDLWLKKPQSKQIPWFHGMVLFAPYDEKDTDQMAKNFLKDAMNLRIKTIQWPASWPVNCRPDTDPEAE